MTPQPMPAPQVLNRDFLEIRAKILELAASFDRLDRGDGDVNDDPRLRQIRAGLAALADGRADRAERVQMIFSQSYEDGWRKKFGI